MGVGLLRNGYIYEIKKDTLFVVRSKNFVLIKNYRTRMNSGKKVMSRQRTVDYNKMRRQNSQKRGHPQPR